MKKEAANENVDAKKRLSPQKRLAILIILLLVGMTVALLLLLRFLPHEKAPQPKLPPRAEGEFAQIDFSEDVTLDSAYMELDRDVRYRHSNGVTYTLTDEDHDDGGPAAAFIYEVLAAIRDGDHVKYNAAFSDYYKNAVGEKAPFTKQKLYDISFNIFKYEDGGEVGTLVSYQIFYRIKDNNGTFRDDVLSDNCRRVTYYLRQTYEGWEIYTVTYEY